MRRHQITESVIGSDTVLHSIPPGSVHYVCLNLYNSSNVRKTVSLSLGVRADSVVRISKKLMPLESGDVIKTGDGEVVGTYGSDMIECFTYIDGDVSVGEGGRVDVQGVGGGDVVVLGGRVVRVSESASGLFVPDDMEGETFHGAMRVAPEDAQEGGSVDSSSSDDKSSTS